MVKIEAESLEDAYAQAAHQLTCSVTELQIEIIQRPKRGLLGFFSKRAIIVATRSQTAPELEKESPVSEKSQTGTKAKPDEAKPPKAEPEVQESKPVVLNETILPESFVTGQGEEEHEEKENGYSYSKKDAEVTETFFEEKVTEEEIAAEVKAQINELFGQICFDIDPIEVSVYDENTLLVEFSGKDAALLIGKEGYRYKALSYMIFNWINSKYQMQLRLEIAEFLKNQEESISRYLIGVCENIDRDGRAQTKVLDGVLVQIALRELRERYPDKYVAIRSTRDGAKFIIINNYNEY